MLLCLQAGLARFPGDPTVLLVYANYIIHVKKEPRAARQQLQLASKGEPNLIERYNIFSANVGPLWRLGALAASPRSHLALWTLLWLECP